MVVVSGSNRELQKTKKVYNLVDNFLFFIQGVGYYLLE